MLVTLLLTMERRGAVGHGDDGECVTAKGTSEPIGSNSLCGLQRHAMARGPMVELRVWLFCGTLHTHSD